MLSRPKNKDVITHNQVPHLSPVPVKETLSTQCPLVALSPKRRTLLPHSPSVLVRGVSL